MMAEVLEGLAAHGEDGNAKLEGKVKAEALEICARFPIYVRDSLSPFATSARTGRGSAQGGGECAARTATAKAPR
jgi:hypothetical protein